MVKTHSRYYDYDTDYERQAKHAQRLIYLKSLLAKKNSGTPLTTEELAYIQLPLQKAGILDAEGNYTEHYKSKE